MKIGDFQNEVACRLLRMILPSDAISLIFSMGVPHKVDGDVLPVVTMALNLFERVVRGNVNYWDVSSRLVPNFRKFHQQTEDSVFDKIIECAPDQPQRDHSPSVCRTRNAFQ